MCDSVRMLEWMHDEKTTKYLMKDFMNYDLDKCRKFIEINQTINSDCHMAVSDDQGMYMGTASLKNIHNSTAEFAIVLHPEARGKGYGSFAIKSIIKYGFENLKIDSIYWNVRRWNESAIRLYERNGYRQAAYEDIITFLGEDETYTEEEKKSFLWYLVKKESNGM